MKTVFFIFSISCILSMPMVFQDKWEVPEAALKLENPTDKTDKENIAIGKSLYMQNCKTCHGKLGHGDGPQAKNLNVVLSDFTSEGFQAQPDGAMFYKLSTGRGVMPGFDKKLEEEDRWLIVDYLRTLN